MFDRPTCLTVFAALLLTACGPPVSDHSSPSPGPEESGEEGEPSADPDEKPVEESCDVAEVPDRLEFTEGALVTIDIPAHLELRSAEFPETWEPRGESKFRTGYGDLPGTLTLEIGCEEATSSVEIETVSRPLAWEELSSVDGPAAREHTVMWIDPSAPDSLYLFGGYFYEPTQFTPAFDMWRFDLEEHVWTEVEQSGDVPTATAGEVALTDEPGVALHIGGTGGGESRSLPSSISSVVVSQDTARWTRREVEDQLGLQLGALVWDEVRGRHLWTTGLVDLGDGMSILPASVALMFEDATTDRPEFDLVEIPEQAVAPTTRYGSSWALDPIHDRLVVVSGAQPPTETDPVNAAEDVWAFQLGEETPRWRKLDPSGDPVVGRRNGCHAYDPEGHRLFIFGGTANGRTSVQGLHVLDLDEGEERWTTLEVVDGPDARASCTAVYDAARKRVLFGFGNNSFAVYDDLWALQL